MTCQLEYRANLGGAVLRATRCDLLTAQVHCADFRTARTRRRALIRFLRRSTVHAPDCPFHSPEW